MTVGRRKQHSRAERGADSGGTEHNLGFTVANVIDDIELEVIIVQIFLNHTVHFSRLETEGKRNVGETCHIHAGGLPFA